MSLHRVTGYLFTIAKKKILLPLGVILRSTFGCAVTHVTVYYWPRVLVGAKNDIHHMIIHVVAAIYHFSRPASYCPPLTQMASQLSDAPNENI